MAIERLDPKHFRGRYVVDHYARYCLAAQFVVGKRVLDVACGYGYGSHFLKMAGAREVIGVDISSEAIEYARKNYSRSDITYVVGDAHRVDEIIDGCFDVVVSFETIEHLTTPVRFIHSCRKIAHEDAWLLFSVPSESHLPPDNEFHLHFYDEVKFRALLEDIFPTIVMKPYYMSLATIIGEPDYRDIDPLYLGDGTVGREGASCQHPEGYIAACSSKLGAPCDYNLVVQSRRSYEDTQQDMQWLEDQRFAWERTTEHHIEALAKLRIELRELAPERGLSLDAGDSSQNAHEPEDGEHQLSSVCSPSAGTAQAEEGDLSARERHLQVQESTKQSWKKTAEGLAIEMSKWRRVAQQRARLSDLQRRANQWIEEQRLAWKQTAERNAAVVARLRIELGDTTIEQVVQSETARNIPGVQEAENVSPAPFSISMNNSSLEKPGNLDISRFKKDMQVLEVTIQSWMHTAQELATEMAAWRKVAEQRGQTLEEQERVNRWLESDNSRIDEAFRAWKVAAGQRRAVDQDPEIMRQALEDSNETIRAMEATIRWRLGNTLRAWFPVESTRGRVMRGMMKPPQRVRRWFRRG